MLPSVTMIFSIEIMSTLKEIKYHLKQLYHKQKSYPLPYPTSNISKHLNKHNALYELQHAFHDLVLLDFSKAFDKVNHLKLLHKLACFGVKGNTLKWIQSFQIDRTQTVVLDGESSNEVPVTSGVPKGSVLGLLLFLLYINALPENIQSQVRLFADDTAVYFSFFSPI